MKNIENDIVIQLHLYSHRNADLRTLMDALSPIESVLFHSDRHDIQNAARKLEIPHIVEDAALERVRHYRNERLRFREIGSGSIVI